MTTTVAPPAAALTLSGLAPSLLQSCILAPTPAVPPTIGDNDIYTPVAPGVTYAALPTVTIVDTSPTQVIGCANDVGTTPQQTLNALFPAAITGDGVVDRATNDFWVYDGTTWNNVGPNPGPTIVDATIIPPWNEILSYDATVRTRLQVAALDYALAILREPDAIGIRVQLDSLVITPVKTPSASLSLAANVPSVRIQDPAVSTVAKYFEYTGNGTEQSIEVGFEPGLLLLASSVQSRNYAYDALRGATKYWVIDTSAIQQTDAQSVKSFDVAGFSVGSASIVNQSAASYRGYAFRPTAAPVPNTAGSIPSTTAVSEAYSVIRYAGNWTAGASFGHGLSTAPQMVWIKRLDGGTANAIAGGPVIGDNNYIDLNFSGDRQADSSLIRTVSSSVVTLGSDLFVGYVNNQGSNYICYAFAEVPGVSKIGTYVGDGNPAGQFIDCGFKVDFLLVKGRNGGTLLDQSRWLLFDRGDRTGKRLIELGVGVPEVEPEVFYGFEGTGFRVSGDDSRMISQINNNGATYIFMAFSYYIPTVEPPVVALSFAAQTPSLRLHPIVPPVTISVTVQPPLYVGRLRTNIFASATSFNLTTQPPQVEGSPKVEDYVQVGTQAPLLGAEGTDDFTGWTRIRNADQSNANIQVSDWPFTFTLDSVGYTAAFVGSNTYITFGSGSNNATNLSATNPALPKIHFGAANNSYQRVFTRTETVEGIEIQRIRYEGNGGTTGSLGVPGIVAEFAFFAPFPDGRQLVELRIGNHNRTDGQFMIANASTSYASSTISPNSSWVFIGNSAGTAWTLTSNRFATI
jgi:hypothetical protein